MNTQKFANLLLNIDENVDIDNCVDNLNKVLTDIFEQYVTKLQWVNNILIRHAGKYFFPLKYNCAYS
jgi:hypothetical protein